ncbi:MAG: NUDIX hydrolase [Nanoarchaeota archaeon]
MEENKIDKFNVLALGIIFDPKEKKILIGKRENDPYIPELTWCIPGTSVKNSEDVDKALKRGLKEKTGYIVKNIGTFFSETHEQKPDLLSVYFLTQVFEGQEKPGGDIKELKWISPKEIDNYCSTNLHRKLKEFLNELV